MASPNPLIVLLCGGAGYIGGHTAIALCASGKYKVVIADNLTNASAEAVDVIKQLCKEAGGFDNLVSFANVDLSGNAVDDLFQKHRFDAVIHFAALKAVGDSVAAPLEYYTNNLYSLLNVLNACEKHGCRNFVYSSSATVYLPNEKLLTEFSPLGASNPYGQTKVMGEQILKDLFVSEEHKPKGLATGGATATPWKLSLLRYFNPIGGHPSGRFGESPAQPKNILPIIQKVAVGRMPEVQVCGNDWPTRDGTGVRDYIHVSDLARGHILALERILAAPTRCLDIYNLGTGRGVSVLEMIKAFEKACGKTIPYKIVGRRPGDLATVVADPAKAQRELNFTAEYTIEQACEHAWKWQSAHPDGFVVTKDKQ